MVYGLWVCAASSRRSSITTSKRLQKYDSRDIEKLMSVGKCLVGPAFRIDGRNETEKIDGLGCSADLNGDI